MNFPKIITGNKSFYYMTRSHLDYTNITANINMTP